MDGQSDAEGDDPPSLVDLGHTPQTSSSIVKDAETRRASDPASRKVPITIVTGLLSTFSCHSSH